MSIIVDSRRTMYARERERTIMSECMRVDSRFASVNSRCASRCAGVVSILGVQCPFYNFRF